MERQPTPGEGLAVPDLADYTTTLDEIVARERGDVVSILQAVQRQFGWLPRNALEYVADRAGVALSQLWGVATFYSSFYLKPRGRTIVRVCHGTACHVRGARRITDALAKHLGLEGTGDTTPDLAYTLEEVACVGCCSLAPVVAIGDSIKGRLSQGDAVSALTSATGTKETP